MVCWRGEKRLRQSPGWKLQGIREKLLKSPQDRDANMSINVIILHSHQDNLPDNCVDVSDEQGENIKTMEACYLGWWDKRMMADYSWNIKRNLDNIEHDNQEREKFYHSSYVYDGFILLLVY